MYMSILLIPIQYTGGGWWGAVQIGKQKVGFTPRWPSSQSKSRGSIGNCKEKKGHIGLFVLFSDFLTFICITEMETTVGSLYNNCLGVTLHKVKALGAFE